MTLYQRASKRAFDLVVAVFALVILSPIILVAALLAKRDTGASAIFSQKRIGRFGKPFTIYKIRTMRPVEGTSITVANDPRITSLGTKLRRFKIDELPQLWNVIIGDMSFVGPRPDVPGYVDNLRSEDKILLNLRPGITGPATLKYRNEEEILAKVSNPEMHNNEIIWPDKVKINKAYYLNWSFSRDLRYIWNTLN